MEPLMYSVTPTGFGGKWKIIYVLYCKWDIMCYSALRAELITHNSQFITKIFYHDKQQVERYNKRHTDGCDEYHKRADGKLVRLVMRI